MKFRLSALAAAPILFTLTACAFMPYYAQQIRNGIEVARESAFVNRTLGAEIRKFFPNAEVGLADCTRDRHTGVYFKVCTLTVDGRTIPIGLRNDPERKRLMAVFLGSAINLRWSERNLVQRARIQYNVRAVARCAGHNIQLIPIGAHVDCVVRAEDGSEHPAKLWVAAKIFPHEVISAITGLRENAAFAARARRIREALGKRLVSVPGAAVEQLIDLQLPAWRATQPDLHFKSAKCPAYMDVRDADLSSVESGISTCRLDTAYGMMRIAVFTADGKNVEFQNISKIFDTALFEHLMGRLEERYLSGRGSSATAQVLCESQKKLILTLLSERYCRVTLSDGRSDRLAIAYEDPFQGPFIDRSFHKS